MMLIHLRSPSKTGSKDWIIQPAGTAAIEVVYGTTDSVAKKRGKRQNLLETSWVLTDQHAEILRRVNDQKAEGYVEVNRSADPATAGATLFTATSEYGDSSTGHRQRLQTLGAELGLALPPASAKTGTFHIGSVDLRLVCNARRFCVATTVMSSASKVEQWTVTALMLALGARFMRPNPSEPGSDDVFDPLKEHVLLRAAPDMEPRLREFCYRNDILVRPVDYSAMAAARTGSPYNALI